ncbi:MAG: hypothetical protein WAL30_01990 [Candidatus Aquirickettsiella sp.]
MNINYFLKLGEQTKELNFYIDKKLENKVGKKKLFELISNYLNHLFDLNEGLIDSVKNDSSVLTFKSYLFNFFISDKNKSSCHDLLFEDDITTLYFSLEKNKDDLICIIQEKLRSVFFTLFTGRCSSCYPYFQDNIGKYISLEVCDPNVYSQSASFSLRNNLNEPRLRFFITDFFYRKRPKDFIFLLKLKDNITEHFGTLWKEDFMRWLRILPSNCEQHNQAKEKLNELSKRFFHNLKNSNEVLSLLRNNVGFFHGQEQHGPIYFYWKIDGIIVYLTDKGFSVSKFNFLNKESYKKIETILIRSLAELYIYGDNCFLEGPIYIQDLSKRNENQLSLQSKMVEKIRKTYSSKYWIGISDQENLPQDLSSLFLEDNANIRACIQKHEMTSSTSFPPSKNACTIWRGEIYQQCIKYSKEQGSKGELFEKPKKVTIYSKRETTPVVTEPSVLSAAIKLDISKVFIIEGSIGATNALLLFALEKLIKEKKRSSSSRLGLIMVKYGTSILITSFTGMLRYLYLNRFSMPFFLNDTFVYTSLVACTTSVAANTISSIGGCVVGEGIQRIGVKYNLALLVKVLFAAAMLLLDKEFYNNPAELSVGLCVNIFSGFIVTAILSILWKRFKKSDERTKPHTRGAISINEIKIDSIVHNRNDDASNTPLISSNFPQGKLEEIKLLWLNIKKILSEIQSVKGYAALIKLEGDITIYIKAIDLFLDTRPKQDNVKLRDLGIRYQLCSILIEKIESFFSSNIKRDSKYAELSVLLEAIKKILGENENIESNPGPIGIKNLRCNFFEVCKKNILQNDKKTSDFSSIDKIFSDLIERIGEILFYEKLWGKFESKETIRDVKNIREITGNLNLLAQNLEFLVKSIMNLKDDNLRRNLFESLDSLRMNLNAIQKNEREHTGFLQGEKKYQHSKVNFFSTNNTISEDSRGERSLQSRP